MNALRRFARDVRGVTSIEHALMAGMIAIVIVSAVRFAGTQTSAAYVGIGNAPPLALRRLPKSRVPLLAAPVRARAIRSHRRALARPLRGVPRDLAREERAREALCGPREARHRHKAVRFERACPSA